MTQEINSQQKIVGEEIKISYYLQEFVCFTRNYQGFSMERLLEKSEC